MLLAKRLNAVRGFLDLGMPEEAEAELAAMPKEALATGEFWRLAVAVAMARRDWTEGVLRAERLVQLEPESGDGYLHLAFCLHENGLTERARRVLEQGPKGLKATAIYLYNMACYEAQLGNVERARELLQRALKLEPGYERIAEKDPDLAPLR